MADPAELIRRIADDLDAESWSLNRACLGEYADQLRALLAALTPAHSAEDAAVLDDKTHERIFDLIQQGVTLVSGSELEIDTDLPDRIAACLARMAGKVPTGWKLVPVEPTTKMMQAVADADALAPTRTSGNPFALFKTLWRAAWMAAPEAPR